MPAKSPRKSHLLLPNDPRGCHGIHRSALGAAMETRPFAATDAVRTYLWRTSRVGTYGVRRGDLGGSPSQRLPRRGGCRGTQLCRPDFSRSQLEAAGERSANAKPSRSTRSPTSTASSQPNIGPRSQNV